MLTVAKIDKYDLVNNPGDNKPACTIWFSGCMMGCDGCHNPELQNHNVGVKHPWHSVYGCVSWIYQRAEVTTVVMTGGDPLDQDQEELEVLCRELYNSKYKIWIYTGREFDEVPQYMKDYAHTIKCGPYIQSLRTDGFPASSNQYIMRKIDGNWEKITLGGQV